jgi:hypothetical protein
MSRRESRLSKSERQNDALFEFETDVSPILSYLTCLPSPHLILQSRRSFSSPINISQSSFTLRYASRPPTPASDRHPSGLIQPLASEYAQISALHVVNLRLRASEITLVHSSRGREKAQHIIVDAESTQCLPLPTSRYQRKQGHTS